MEYEIEIRIDLGQAVPAVGELMESINTTMTSCGCDERIQCLGTIGKIDLTVNRTLTNQEKEKIKMLLQEQFSGHFSKYSISVGEFRCKSVTSELSVS